MTLAESVYRLTETFPKSEIYGMTSQIRRSAVSIAANIAEGHGRESRGSFIQFLRISQGSLKELETHIILAHRVGFITEKTMLPLLTQTEKLGKMIRALIRKLQEKQTNA